VHGQHRLTRLLCKAAVHTALTSIRVGCHRAHAAASCCLSMSARTAPGKPPTNRTLLLRLTALCLGGGGATADLAAAAGMPGRACARGLSSWIQYLAVALDGVNNWCLLSNIMFAWLGSSTSLASAADGVCGVCLQYNTRLNNLCLNEDINSTALSLKVAGTRRGLAVELPTCTQRSSASFRCVVQLVL
jgi:hypothetical protein